MKRQIKGLNFNYDIQEIKGIHRSYSLKLRNGNKMRNTMKCVNAEECLE